MNGFETEHLEAVAERNADLFFNDKRAFEKRLLLLGWNTSEIQQMEKHLERKNKNERIKT